MGNNNIDTETVRQVKEKLQTLDAESLRGAIRRAAMSAGANPLKAERTAANAEKLKQQMATLSEKDVTALLRRVDPEKVAAVMRQLKQDGLL